MVRAIIVDCATRLRVAYVGPRGSIPQGFALVRCRPARRRNVLA